MDISVEKLYQSNLPPSVAEKDSVCQLLVETEDEISRLHIEISELTRKANALVHRRTQLEEHAVKFKSILSPIRKLPFELLTEIFLCHKTLVLPHAGDDGGSNQSEIYRQSPLLPCQVSSSWRTVALSTSELWDILPLCIQQHVHHHTLHADYAMRCRAKAHFTRAGGRPVWLDIVNKARVGSLPEKTIAGILGALPNSSKINRLSLHNCTADYTDIFELPAIMHLRSLTVSLIDTGLSVPVWGERDEARIAATFPLLLTHNVPWSQLAHLDFLLPDVRPDRWHTMLAQCTSVVECKLSINGLQEPAEFHHDDPTSVVFPALRSLDISVQILDFNYFAELFDGFSFPALKELSLTYSCEQPGLFESSRFMALKRRSSLDLERFRLTNLQDATGQDISAFIADMPSLSNLSITRSDEIEDLITDLTYQFVDVDGTKQLQQGAIATNLTAFEYGGLYCEHNPDHFPKLLKMLESRCPSGDDNDQSIYLKEAAVRFDEEREFRQLCVEDAKTAEFIVGLRERGLDLSFDVQAQ